MADLMPTSYNNADPALSACGSPNAYVTIEGIEFTTNKYGVVRQQNPIPFQYDLHYLAKQSTNREMAHLRIGYLMAYVPYEVISRFRAVGGE